MTGIGWRARTKLELIFSDNPITHGFKLILLDLNLTGEHRQTVFRRKTALGRVGSYMNTD